jgi:hypothetical protein
MNIWTIEHAPFPGEHADDRTSEATIRRNAGIGAYDQPSRMALAFVFLATFTLSLLTLSCWGTL